MKASAPRMLLVLCACPDEATAESLAEDAVGAHLAACASLVPGLRSVYRWEGRIQRAQEVLLMLKTTPAHWDALRDRLAAAHPYELPEIVAVEPATGLAGYLQWVADETAPSLPGHR